MTLIFNSAKPYITSSSVSSPSLSTKGWWSWNLLWKARVMDDYREDNSKMKKKCRVKLRSNALYYSNSEKKKNLTLTSRSLINVAILFVSITLFDRSSLVNSNCFLQYSSVPCSKHLHFRVRVRSAYLIDKRLIIYKFLLTKSRLFIYTKLGILNFKVVWKLRLWYSLPSTLEVTLKIKTLHG